MTASATATGPSATAPWPWLHRPIPAFDAAARWALVLAAFALAMPVGVLNAAAGLLLLLWLLAGGWAERARRLAADPVARVALLLMGWLLLSVAWSPAPWREALADALRYQGLLAMLIARSVIDDDRWGWRITAGFVAGVAVALALAWMRFAGLLPLTEATCSFGGDCGRIGFSMLLAVVAALAAALGARPTRGRAAWLALAALAVGYLFLVNLGRTGQLALLAVLPYALHRKLGWKGSVAGLALAAAAVGAVLTLVPAAGQRLQTSIDDLARVRAGDFDNNLGHRIEMYSVTLRIAGAHPLAGGGAASLVRDYEAVARADPRVRQRGVRNPHNEYLRLWAQQGLPGLLLFVALGWAHWRAARSLPPAQAFATHALVIAFYAGALLNSLLYDIPEGYLLGLLGAAFTRAWPPPPAPRPLPA